MGSAEWSDRVRIMDEGGRMWRFKQGMVRQTVLERLSGLQDTFLLDDDDNVFCPVEGAFAGLAAGNTYLIMSTDDGTDDSRPQSSNKKRPARATAVGTTATPDRAKPAGRARGMRSSRSLNDESDFGAPTLAAALGVEPRQGGKGSRARGRGEIRRSRTVTDVDDFGGRRGATADAKSMRKSRTLTDRLDFDGGHGGLRPSGSVVDSKDWLSGFKKMVDDRDAPGVGGSGKKAVEVTKIKLSLEQKSRARRLYLMRWRREAKERNANIIDAFGCVAVKIMGAEHLMERVDGREPDAYCVVETDSLECRTTVIPSSADPRWDEEYMFTITNPSERLRLTLFDDDPALDLPRELGSFDYSITQLHDGEPKCVISRLRGVEGADLSRVSMRLLFFYAVDDDELLRLAPAPLRSKAAAAAAEAAQNATESHIAGPRPGFSRAPFRSGGTKDAKKRAKFYSNRASAATTTVSGVMSTGHPLGTVDVRGKAGRRKGSAMSADSPGAVGGIVGEVNHVAHWRKDAAVRGIRTERASAFAYVRVTRGRGLADVEGIEPDAFCVLSVGRERQKTNIAFDGAPWDQEFYFTLSNTTATIRLECFAAVPDAAAPSVQLGATELRIADLVAGGAAEAARMRPLLTRDGSTRAVGLHVFLFDVFENRFINAVPVDEAAPPRAGSARPGAKKRGRGGRRVAADAADVRYDDDEYVDEDEEMPAAAPAWKPRGVRAAPASGGAGAASARPAAGGGGSDEDSVRWSMIMRKQGGGAGGSAPARGGSGAASVRGGSGAASVRGGSGAASVRGGSSGGGGGGGGARSALAGRDRNRSGVGSGGVTRVSESDVEEMWQAWRADSSFRGVSNEGAVGMLAVDIKGARGLTPNTAQGGAQKQAVDAYCEVSYGPEHQRTSVCERTNNPQWSGSRDSGLQWPRLYFSVKKAGSGELIVRVKDNYSVGQVTRNPNLGWVSIPLSDLEDRRRRDFEALALQDGKGGTLRLSVAYCDVSKVSFTEVSRGRVGMASLRDDNSYAARMRKSSDAGGQDGGDVRGGALTQEERVHEARATADVEELRRDIEVKRRYLDAWRIRARELGINTDGAYGCLVVRVIEGEDLVAVDRGGTSDPYVIVQYGDDQTEKSEIIEKELNPKWDAEFLFTVRLLGTDKLQFTVKDHNVVSKDKVIGYANFDPNVLTESVRRREMLKLTSVEHGSITVEMTLFRSDEKESVASSRPDAAVALRAGTDDVEVDMTNLTEDERALLKQRDDVLALWQRKVKKAEYERAIGCVVINVVAGIDLLARDRSGTSDPYVRLSLRDSEVKTKHISRNCNPIWDEEFVMSVFAPSDKIEIECRDYDKVGSGSPIGSATFALEQLTEGTKYEEWVGLDDAMGEEESGGMLQLEFTLYTKSGNILATRALAEQVKADSLERSSSNELRSTAVDQLEKSRVAAEKRARILEFRNVYITKWWEEAGKKISARDREKLLGIVVVRMIEGKNLVAMDRSGTSDPYCKVCIGDPKTRPVSKTKIIKKTLEPHWDETLLLTMRDEDYLDDPPASLRVECWDWDRVGGDDKMGWFHIPVTQLEKNVPYEDEFVLRDVAHGKIHMEVTFFSFTDAEIVDSSSGDVNLSNPDATLENAVLETLKGAQSTINSLFKEMDLDGNGLIDVEEFQHGVSKYGLSLTQEECIRVMKRIDLNFDGQLNRRELSDFLAGKTGHGDQRLRLHEIEEQVRDTILVNCKKHGCSARELFTKLDTSRSGQMDDGKLKRVLKEMGLFLHKDDVSLLISVYDLDNSGTIGAMEFEDMAAYEGLADEEGEEEIERKETKDAKLDDYLKGAVLPSSREAEAQQRNVIEQEDLGAAAEVIHLAGGVWEWRADWQFAEEANGWIKFEARAPAGVAVAIATDCQITNPLYEFVIGDAKNEQTSLRRKHGGAVRTKKLGKHLDDEHFSKYWVSLTGANLQMGQGWDVGSDVLIDFVDQRPIKQAAFVGFGNEADGAVEIRNVTIGFGEEVLYGAGAITSEDLLRSELQKQPQSPVNTEDLVKGMRKSFKKKDSSARGGLVVKLLKGVNLAIRDDNGLSDPYVKLRVGKGKEQKSKVIQKNLNPVWNEEFHFPVHNVNDMLLFRCFDKDKFSKDDDMGDYEISVKELQDCLELTPMVLSLENVESGELHVAVQYVPLMGE